MKKIFLLYCLLQGFMTSQAQCPNGDVEMNSFANWQGYTGTNTDGTLNLSLFTPGIMPGRHSIVSSTGNDPIVGSPMPLVLEGSYAFQIGNTTKAKQAEIMSYTFTVPENFSFKYALVLQDPPADHAPAEKPFFSYWVSTSANLVNSIAPGNLIVQKKFVADVNNNFFRQMTYEGEPLVYKEWQTECVEDLAGYVGQTVTIYFSTNSCTKGAHFGYAYIDGLCKTVPPTPFIRGGSEFCNIDDPVNLDGSGTFDESMHYWRIEECDAAGNPAGTSSVQTLIDNAPAGSISVKALWTTLGRSLESGKYYKVTLFVKNCSSGWISTYQIIKIAFPPIINQNKIICCGSSVMLTAKVSGLGSRELTSYKWYDEDGTFLGNGTMNLLRGNWIMVTPSKSTKYRVVYEYGGCKNEKWVYVTTIRVNVAPFNGWTFSMGLCLFPKYVMRNVVYYLSCDNTNNVNDYEYHHAAAEANINYLWNTGETTPYIMGQPNTPYSVTVTTPCGANTYDVNLYKPEGAIPNLYIPDGFTPNGDGLNDRWEIYNYGMQIGQSPAYNGNKFRLRVWDSWSQLIYEQTMETNTGFNNGIIGWDGLQGGIPVNPNDTYNYELIIWNCGSERQFSGTVDVVQ